MLQALERKPTQGCIDENSLDKNSANEVCCVLWYLDLIESVNIVCQHQLWLVLQDDSPVNVRNPHKFLLYKPTLLQLVNFISNGVKVMNICLKLKSII